MTISNTSNRTSAVGTGAEQVVSFSFPIVASSELLVKTRVKLTGVEATLAKTTHFTVTINGDAGGSITTVTPFVADTKEIHIIRVTPTTQLLDLTAGGAFSAEIVEAALDKRAKVEIDNQQSVARCLSLSLTDPATTMILPPAATRKGKYLYFGVADGAPTVADEIVSSTAVVSAFMETVLDDADAAAARATLGVSSPSQLGFVNVADHGAPGDGTDQTTAIASAIAAGAAAFLPVYFPTGTYRISSRTIIPTGIKLFGPFSSYSANGAVIISDVSADACLQMSDAGGNGTTAVGDIGLENIRINAGNHTNGIGVQILAAYRCTLRNVAVYGFITGKGLKIAGNAAGDIAAIQTLCDNVYLARNLVNLELNGHDDNDDSSSDEGLFTNLRINLNGLVNAKGVYIGKGFNNTFVRPTVFDSNGPTAGTIAFYFDDGARTEVYAARDNVILNSYVENATTAIHFEEKTSGNCFYGAAAHVPAACIFVTDNSGGANIVRYATGGRGLGVNATCYGTNQTAQNLVVNSEFERWEAGAAVAPTGWVLTTGAVAREGTVFRKGAYSAKLTRAATDAVMYHSITPYLHLAGRYVSMGCWVKSSIGDGSTTGARIYILSAAGVTTHSRMHTGGGGWEFLTLRHKVDAATNGLNVVLQIYGVNGSAYFDQMVLVEGYECPLPNDKPLLDSQRLHATVVWDPGELVDGAGETKSLTVNGAALGDCVLVGAPYDLQNCIAVGYVQAANAVRIRLQNESTGTIDFASGTWTVQVLKI